MGKCYHFTGADPANPGPGAYNPLIPIGENALKFKLKGKLHYGEAERLALKEDLPPPGTYENQLTLDKLGKYNQNSEWSNSKVARWGPQHDRFTYPKTTP